MNENEIRKDERKQIANQLIDLERAMNKLRFSTFERIITKDKVNLDELHRGLIFAIDTILDIDRTPEEMKEEYRFGERVFIDNLIRKYEKEYGNEE